MTGTVGLIDLQIMWNRLIAVVEEQAQSLQRTAFSTIVRESGDLAAGVFDAKGRMLAQAVTGTPGHINSMALAVGHVLDRYPADVMKPGDVFVHNDPWMGTGHTNDISLTTPCFRDGRLIGIVACNCHVFDIGGAVPFMDTTDVFMEGLYIPILKIVDAGVVNETLFEMIRANTREPIETVGDVYSLVSCNDVGCERLLEMMDEFAIDELDQLADYIIDTSREAVLAEIRKLPRGTWHHSMLVDAASEPIRLAATLTVSDSGIHVDFTGSADMVKYNVNVPICYTHAYTSFGLGCIVSHGIPNNAGSLEPLTISAPPGCIVNALKPAAVFARATIGMMMPDLVFGCLRQAVPDRVPAENTSVLWRINARGPRTSPAKIDETYAVNVLTNGGMGALPGRDGLSATGYPSGVRGGPIEIFEGMSTVIVWRKELRPDSGGAGATRGGLGQIIEVENSIDQPFMYQARLGRQTFPARGYAGGKDGALGRVGLRSNPDIPALPRYDIVPGDRLIVMTPGGGGLGDPAARPRALVEADLAEGRISPEAARDIYRLDPSA